MDTTANARTNQPVQKNALISRNKNSIVVSPVSSTHQVVLSDEDFDKWLSGFRNRYAELFEYLRSH